MKRQLGWAALLAMISVTSTGFAATAPALFSGTVLSTCVLTVGTPGILTPNASYSKLSSDNAGGSESTVSALATGTGFKVSAIAPSAFTTGPTAADTFVSKYSLSGANTASNVAGATTTTLTPGTSLVSVGLEADKSTGTFGAGAYTAAVTVRCE
jgi:hypothetical protein